jgi:hypothetical protein
VGSSGHAATAQGGTVILPLQQQQQQQQQKEKENKEGEECDDDVVDRMCARFFSE